ncbi:MAG: DUF975 family protein [Coprococcus sp.]
MFFRDLFILLWTLLLIVPGIIKSYSYRLVPYILSENPHMDRKRALELSQQMMDGHKMEAFVLELSFFGWFLLSALTCRTGWYLLCKSVFGCDICRILCGNPNREHRKRTGGRRRTSRL